MDSNNPLKDFKYKESREELEKKYLLIRSNPLFVETLNSVNTILLVLNSYRQVVFYNSALMTLLGLQDEEELLTLKPGAVFKCVNTTYDKDACGTTKSCTYCGIFNTFLRSIESNQLMSGEAVLEIEDGKNRDIMIGSKPIIIEGITFFIITIEDISEEKRKRALERVFFHDIINSAGGLDGLFSILEMDSSEENLNKILPMARGIVSGLLDEIVNQRELVKAENDELKVKKEYVRPEILIRGACEAISYHPVAKGRKLDYPDTSTGLTLSTDKTLMRRVLINLLKNALEATPSGGTVTANCGKDNGSAWFSVHNNQVIPREVQDRLFKRSFSTKGSDRGLGLYSIKLFTEKYLGGSINFTSSEDEGTTFTVTLPG